MAVNFFYNYNRQIDPPAPFVNREVEVVVGDDNYAIIGRDILNHFDLRLNGIDGKLEFLRGPQAQIVF